MNEILELDARNKFFVRINLDTGEQRRPTIVDHCQEIERYHLADYVPDAVAIKNDVARHMYAYAWFKYRFFNVAKVQCL